MMALEGHYFSSKKPLIGPRLEQRELLVGAKENSVYPHEGVIDLNYKKRTEKLNHWPDLVTLEPPTDP